jgi:hypothetical protein
LLSSHVLVIGKTVDEHGKGRNFAKPCMKPFDEMMDRDEDAWHLACHIILRRTGPEHFMQMVGQMPKVLKVWTCGIDLRVTRVSGCGKGCNGRCTREIRRRRIRGS